MLDLFDVCNRTVLYVSHDIDEACRLCQRICVMHDGHVEEIGSVEDVVRRPQTSGAAPDGDVRIRAARARLGRGGRGPRLGHDL